IISQYPKKSVTIIQSSNRLLSDAYPLKLSKKLQKDLESRGVRVVLGQRVEKDVANAGKGNVILKDGTIIDADLVVNASGVTLNTKLVSSYDAGAVNTAGAITVDKNLRVVSSNPQSALVTSPYFAIGDCSSSRGGPTAIKAGSDAGAAAVNILATLSRTALKPSPAPLQAIMIPVGPLGGATTMPMLGTVGPFMTSMAKGKALLVPMFEKTYPASK
ncbi:hypothetical protein BDY24DRAFT_428020, partial [Mrakia frigida]|uniref:uncharacterized protein n=1 Tax=Mrakia frigida TaxID=29902 RepID=UPI003FCC010B